MPVFITCRTFQYAVWRNTITNETDSCFTCNTSVPTACEEITFVRDELWRKTMFYEHIFINTQKKDYLILNHKVIKRKYWNNKKTKSSVGLIFSKVSCILRGNFWVSKFSHWRSCCQRCSPAGLTGAKN